MKMSRLSVLALCAMLTACATARDGVSGKFHRFDATEYAQTVHILKTVRGIEPQCSNFAHAQRMIDTVSDQLDHLVLYSEARPYNQRMVSLVLDVRKLIIDTQARNTMSELFCQERARNLVRAAETLRSTSGAKPE